MNLRKKTTESMLEKIEALQKTGTQDAANELFALTETTDDKNIIKAAKRALYLLSQKGIVPIISATTLEPTAKPEIPVDTLRVYASAYDGEGNSLVLVVEADKDGGSPYVTQVLVNDQAGIRNFGGGKLSRQELNERVTRFQSQIDNGIAFAEITPEEGRRVLQQAQSVHNNSRGRTPRGFSEWTAKIGVQKGTPVTLLTLPEELNAIASDTEPDADALFNLPYFETWFFDQSLGIGLLSNLFQTGKVGADVSEEERNEALAGVMRNGAEDVFQPDVREVFRKRLEYSASILWRLDKKDEAKMAIAHARLLQSETPSADIAFARTLCERTMWAAYEMNKREQQEKEERK